MPDIRQITGKSTMHDFGPVDHIGPALRELDSAVTDLLRISENEPKRLHGDATLIDGALLSLLLIRKRIEDLEQARMSEAAE